jgi:hypothetical protein
VVQALENLPWVDADKTQINDQLQILVSIKDLKQYKEKDLLDALDKNGLTNGKVLKKGT